MLKSQISINNKTLDLMEFSKMSVIQSFISEHSINREEFSWSKWLFFCNHLQVSRRNSSCMSTQYVLVGLFRIPLVVVSFTSKSSFFMNIFNSLEIFFIFNCCRFWMWDKKSIMCISCWMSLRLEKSIEVPERTFHITICFHFLETHFNQDLDQLSTCLHQKMKISILNIQSFSSGVELFKRSLLPRTIC